MHELGLCESLVDAVLTEAGDRPVAGVRVRLASAHALDREVLELGFALAAEGTVADGAALELVVTSGRATCLACGEEATDVQRMPLCPSCGCPELVADDSATVEAVTYREGADVPDHEPTRSS